MNKKIFIITICAVLFAGIACFSVIFLIKNNFQNSGAAALPEEGSGSERSSAANDKIDIEYIFEQYKAAALDRDSELAIECLSQNTIDHYADILDLVKRGTKEEIQNRDSTDQFTILFVRNNFDRSVISELNSGEDILALAFREGLIGEQDIPDLFIRSIKISGETASAEIRTKYGVAPQKFSFVKERSVWKFDLVSIFPESDIVFKSMAKESNLTEEEFIFQTLEQQSGVKPDDSIWQPLF